MAIETNVRVRRHSAAILNFQSAKGTIQNDLRLASGGVRIWTRQAHIPVAKSKSAPRWFQEHFSNNQSDRYSVYDNPSGTLYAVATPENVKALLQSNWGPFSGSPATSTLASVVNQYATIGWLESYLASSPNNLVQLQDVWVHRIRFQAHKHDKVVWVHGDFEGRAVVVTAIPNLGTAGIQVTAAPMTPGDVRVYSVRKGKFVRDPLGLNISIDFISLDIVIDQQVNSEWTFDSKWDVRKRGKTRIIIGFEAKLSDESWAILTNNQTGAKERFQFQLVSDGASPSTMTMDIFSVDFEFEDIGHEEPGFIVIRGKGGAFLTAQPPETGFCLFTIS